MLLQRKRNKAQISRMTQMKVDEIRTSVGSDLCHPRNLRLILLSLGKTGIVNREFIPPSCLAGASQALGQF